MGWLKFHESADGFGLCSCNRLRPECKGVGLDSEAVELSAKVFDIVSNFVQTQLGAGLRHAPPPTASEVHTCLGNIEMGRKYGMPAHLCQYEGKLYISRLAGVGRDRGIPVYKTPDSSWDDHDGPDWIGGWMFRGPCGVLGTHYVVGRPNR